MSSVSLFSFKSIIPSLGLADICGTAQTLSQLAAHCALLKCTDVQFVTNDIDPSLSATIHLDASSHDFCAQLLNMSTCAQPDVVVTCPPYNLCRSIIKRTIHLVVYHLQSERQCPEPWGRITLLHQHLPGSLRYPSWLEILLVIKLSLYVDILLTFG